MRLYQKIMRSLSSRAQGRKARRILKRLERGGAEYKKGPAYEGSYEPDRDYSRKKARLRAVAFYLPQFHAFAENDRWWGRGFTEWTNTEKCTPRFPGHYQPRRPHADIGFYDLSAPQAVQRQAELALRHKLYGFCFYYYWFSGKTLMEKPLEIFLEHPQWELHFCLCWANENFTRAWDGAKKEILMEQQYRESDPPRFIAGIKKYMKDPRYIRLGGRPVLLIYDMGSIPRLKKTIAGWREEAAGQGIGEICILMCRTHNNTARILHATGMIDGEVEFPPHNMWWPAIREKGRAGAGADIFDYRRLVDIQAARMKAGTGPKKPLYHACMTGWDNACRRKDGWTAYCGYSPQLFQKWLRAIAEADGGKAEDERIFFVNAWNEWGEGTYLEPDERYGYASINALSDVICGE